MSSNSRWGGYGCGYSGCECGTKVQMPVQEKCYTVKKCCKETASCEQKMGCQGSGTMGTFGI